MEQQTMTKIKIKNCGENPCIKDLSEYIYGLFRNMDFITDFNRLNRFIKIHKDITLNNNVIYKDIYKDFVIQFI